MARLSCAASGPEIRIHGWRTHYRRDLDVMAFTDSSVRRLQHGNGVVVQPRMFRGAGNEHQLSNGVVATQIAQRLAGRDTACESQPVHPKLLHAAHESEREDHTVRD